MPLGGAVGLTEKPAALLRWLVAGPEMARVVNEFVRGLEKTEAASQPSHHEDKPCKTTMCVLLWRPLLKVLISPLSYHSKLFWLVLQRVYVGEWARK